MRKSNYGIELVWDERDKGYIARCASFPDLSAFGSTREEALRNGEAVLDMFIEEYEEEGIPLPEAHLPLHYSGQLRLRMRKSLHAELVRLATYEGVSLNTLINDFLSERVGARSVAGYSWTRDSRATADVVSSAPLHFPAFLSGKRIYSKHSETYQDPVLRDIYSREQETASAEY